MYEIINMDIIEWCKAYKGKPFAAAFCDPPYHLTSIVKRFGKDSLDNDTLTADKVRNGVDGYSRLIRTGFMGQQWDGGDIAFQPETWAAIGDCLLPGAHLLAFGGTRTWHRLACAIEDAGFEIFDTVVYCYGSGFPKSHNISKSIDRKAGAEREIIGVQKHPTSDDRTGDKSPYQAENSHLKGSYDITAPATDLAKTWDGYGTALKPAWEPIICARKPVEGTIADNCIKYGAGAINIDGCRVPVNGETVPINKLEEWSGFGQKERPDYVQELNNKGRWPANLIHDGSEEVVSLFPNTGASKKRPPTGKPLFAVDDEERAIKWNPNNVMDTTERGVDDNGGSASRFFYTAKVSPSERNAGLDEFEATEQGHNRFDKCAKCDGYILQNPDRPSACKCEEPERVHPKLKNNHPTLKPLALTEYLARLILPPEEYAPRRLLVPFAGAASEMIGAYQAGWDEIIGVELMEEYVKIAEARLKYWTGIPKQLELK